MPLFRTTHLYPSVLGSLLLLGQPQPLATEAARVAQLQQERQRLQRPSYDLARYPLTEAHATHWRRLLWATALQQPQQTFVWRALQQILSRAGAENPTLAEAHVITQALQVSHLYFRQHPASRTHLRPSLEQVVATSPHPQWVALAVNTLARPLPLEQRQPLIAQVRRRFPQPSELLAVVLQDLEQPPQPLPPLTDLLAWQAYPSEMQLYVFCPRNRWRPCTLLVKDDRGEFYREQGRLWSRQLLSQSVYALEWPFTYGQTPQGLQRVEGRTDSRSGDLFRAYGQFPLVKLFLPFETGVRAFFPPQPGPFRGSLADYLERLPPTWRDYTPLRQSYYAGRLGRNLLRIHGTGDAPTLFARPPEGQHDWNPALGCLTALERYGSQGELGQADMPEILRVLASASSGRMTGYLLVVEVPDEQASDSQATLACQRNHRKTKDGTAPCDPRADNHRWPS
ncbi:MAG: hypothetical protein RMI89_00215 [Gloeomargarita sp. SKYBB_i_bin120]|nr:hypothetical protein [Gloeomargarita sp. SKYG98]MCS7291386.1 hypothetical protein [Gloeomargarita sp. SKYB120]MDW8176946.1 hypothetical protein [Gloeomargarita sp. SKYBB_i_bin120]